MKRENTMSIDSVKKLFDNSSLPQQANDLIINSLNDTSIAGCIGTLVDELETDDITIVSIILDSSGSMNQFEQIVIDSYNKFIMSLRESKQSGSILVSTRSFDSTQKILHGFKKVDEINPISGKDYSASGASTSLYDTLMDALTGAEGYALSLVQSGVRVKRIVVVFSDGDDNSSHKVKSIDVKTVSEGLLKSEMTYLVYVGYQQNQQNQSSDLKKIAAAVGFPNVLTAKATESEIRRTMDLVSKSIIRKSQTQITSTNTFFSN